MAQKTSIAKSSSSKESDAVTNILDFGLIIKIISKNWYIPVISLGLAYLFSYFYTYKLTEWYRVQAQILLQSNTEYYKGSIVSDDSYYGNTMKSYIDNSNEIRVISSYDMIEEAVNQLKDRLQVSYFIAGKIRTSEEFNFIPFEIKVINVASNQQERRLKFKIVDTSNYIISYKGKDGLNEEVHGKFNSELVDINFHLLVKRNPLSANAFLGLRNTPYEFEIHSVEYLVRNIQGQLNVENPEYTNILKLALDDIIPDRAQLVLDTLIEVYKRNSLKFRKDINRNTLRYIKMQMDTIEDTLRIHEDALQRYKETKQILGDVSKEEADYFAKLNTIDGERGKLKLAIKALGDLETYIREDKDPQFLPPDIFFSEGDAFLSKSANSLYQKQIELNALLNSVTDNNPSVVITRNEIKKMKLDLLIYINNSRKAYNLMVANLDSEVNRYRDSILTIPGKQRDLLSIQRMVDVNQGLYTFLLQKKANTEISSVAIISETKTLESPRSLGVIRPDKKKLSMNFLIGGLIAGLLIVVVRVILFSRIESVEELKQKTKLPIVGGVSEIKNLSNKGIFVDVEPRSIATEAFRAIRTNIRYMSPEPGSKVILITSNAPGEGKTFTVLNLAGILAKAGKRTLILELDMHKPRVQKALEIEPDKGISSVIIGKDKIEDSIKQTVVENLFALLSGPLPPNPSDLILSEALGEIIEYGKKNFDYVVIDTPPAGLISDALMLVHYADISIFVVNSKFATTSIIRRAEEMVKVHDIKNFSFLMNGVKIRRRRYYNKYGYGYGYGGYGGGYGYGYSGGYGYGKGGYSK